MTSHPQETVDKAKFHIVLVQAVAFKEGKVLVAQRGWEELQAPGLWSLPGGKVELYGRDSEVIEKTLQAEFREEVDIELEPEIVYLKSGSFIRKDGSSVISLCFLAQWKSGQAKPLEDSIAVQWIGLDEVGTLQWAEGIEPLVRLAFEKIVSYSHYNYS